MTVSSKNGFTLISLTVALVVFSISFIALIRSWDYYIKATRRAEERVIAQAHATELMELLRSQSASQLQSYHGVNPADPKSKNLYRLCSKINYIDEVTGKVMNPEPAAALENSRLDGHDEFTRPSRYYFVEVVKLETLSGVQPACSRTLGPPGKLGGYSLSENERFMVTVGVSWVTRDSIKRRKKYLDLFKSGEITKDELDAKAPVPRKRVEVSSVLPRV